jgi:hypothetical protein
MKATPLVLFFCAAAGSHAAAPALPDFNSKIGLPPLSLADRGKGADEKKSFAFTERLPAPPPMPKLSPRIARNSGMPVLEPNPAVDYKMIVQAPDPSTDFKLIVKDPGADAPK